MADLDFSGLNPDCFGKVPYVSKGEAQTKIGRMKRRRIGNGAKRLGAYRCPSCKAWHIRAERIGSGPLRDGRWD